MTSITAMPIQVTNCFCLIIFISQGLIETMSSTDNVKQRLGLSSSSRISTSFAQRVPIYTAYTDSAHGTGYLESSSFFWEDVVIRANKQIHAHVNYLTKYHIL